MMPSKCNNSKNLGGVWICRLEVIPCPVFYGDGKCAKEKMGDFVKAMKELVGGKQDE